MLIMAGAGTIPTGGGIGVGDSFVSRNYHVQHIPTINTILPTILALIIPIKVPIRDMVNTRLEYPRYRELQPCEYHYNSFESVAHA